MKPADRIVMRVLSLFCLAIGVIPKKCHARVARVVGRLWFVLDNRHRSIAIDNLKQAFPAQAEPAEIEALAQRVFVSFSRLLLEVCWAMQKSLDGLSRHIDRSDMRFIKAALKKNKGALILTGHLGNWELLPYVPSLEKINNHAVYRPLDFKPVDRFVIQMRSRFGTDLIPATHALRKIVAALKKNEIVGLLIDQNSDPHNGVVVDFFGRPAFATKGLALIARQTGAPVVPAFLVREKDRFRFVSAPEIPFVRTGDARKDIEVNTQRYNLAIEHAVRQYPEQWFWVHRRWKTQPSSPWPRQLA
ncbi:MAG: lysophospholipid acyltransferase family protein [Desulfosarcina sp.]